jgi:hypothetical protein
LGYVPEPVASAVSLDLQFGSVWYTHQIHKPVHNRYTYQIHTPVHKNSEIKPQGIIHSE